MNRGSFLKALAVVPFVPRVLERLKPAPSERLIHYRINGIEYAKPLADEPWLVEFAGATFLLDSPCTLTYGGEKIATSPTYSATAPFECRMGVDHMGNGWKRLWVARGGKTYVTFGQKGKADVPDSAVFTGMRGELVDWHKPAPDWWPRRIR